MRPDCADQVLVKYFKGSNSNEFKMSDMMTVETNSYIVRDLVPSVYYNFQVIAREDKGWFGGVEFNRSPKAKFRTSSIKHVVKIQDPLPSTKSDDNSHVQP